MYLKLLTSHLMEGQLTLVLPNGETHRFGSGSPEVEWVITKDDTMKRIVRDYEFELGETYMNEGWEIRKGTLLDLLEILMRNFPVKTPEGFQKLLMLPKYLLQQLNWVERSYENVAHHYDIDAWLYRGFLDTDMHYSCAYFEYPGQSLEDAQQAKCHHIMKKLCLEPGQKVLDVGCGWSGLSMYLAEQGGVEVTGITLSKEQLRVGQQRVKERGLESRVHLKLQDYREHQGSYDRIVSVGMFEHVGRPNFRTYFQTLKQLLKPDGVAMVHTIGRLRAPGGTNPWMHKYIFPGGYLPAVSEVSRTMEQEGIVTTDIEFMRIHYAETLAEWNRRFQKIRNKVKAEKGERFCRMWEFYLLSCEAAFRWRALVVFQIQFGKQITTEVPLTRDYMYEKKGDTASA